jgi:hypothetical protein
MNRSCGGCTLCCKLLPVRELHKQGGERCQHQRQGKGCAVYQQPPMPPSCRLWTCRWLYQDDTADLSRPDRSHYVLDIMPDFITATDDSGTFDIEIIQIWVDPKYPDAHHDPALRAYLAEQGKRNVAGLIRYGETEAFVLVPPAMTGGEWIEHRDTQMRPKTHSAQEVHDAIGRFL